MLPFLTSWKLSRGLFLKLFNCLRLEWAPQYTSVTPGTVADIRRKKESNKSTNVHQDPRGEKGCQQWRQWWGGGEARSVLGCRHMNPPVHSLGGSKGCMGLLGVPVLYKILKVGYWIWEQGTGHHDDLRDKIKERKNKLSKATQLKWKATALPLESRGTVLLSPVRIRVPWGPGIYPLWDWHRWSLAPHRMADCFGFFPLHAGGSSLPPSSRDWKTGTEQRS